MVLKDEPKILRLSESHGNVVFRNGLFNLNLIGERRAINTDVFDDIMHGIWKTALGWEHFQWECTTDPGSHWLKHPMRVQGTGILVPGQYRGAYKEGWHRGRYRAICQTAGPVRAYRDNDRDNQHDLDPSTIETGMFGANIHRATASGRRGKVHKWSAMCQVLAKARDFAELMAVYRRTASNYGPEISYTLLDTRNG